MLAKIKNHPFWTIRELVSLKQRYPDQMIFYFGLSNLLPPASAVLQALRARQWELLAMPSGEYI